MWMLKHCNWRDRYCFTLITNCAPLAIGRNLLRQIIGQSTSLAHESQNFRATHTRLAKKRINQKIRQAFCDPLYCSCIYNFVIFRHRLVGTKFTSSRLMLRHNFYLDPPRGLDESSWHNASSWSNDLYEIVMPPPPVPSL